MADDLMQKVASGAKRSKKYERVLREA